MVRSAGTLVKSDSTSSEVMVPLALLVFSMSRKPVAELRLYVGYELITRSVTFHCTEAVTHSILAGDFAELDACARCIVNMDKFVQLIFEALRRVLADFL